MSILTNGIKLENAILKSDEILGAGYAIPGTLITPTYIVIHNSGLWDMTARELHLLQKNDNENCTREASWHFSVDHNEIIQSIDTNWMAWNTASSIGHKETIGIEICQFRDESIQRIVEDNAIALVHEIAKIHNFNLHNCIKKHQDYSGKFCPEVILSRPNGWNEFLTRIYNYIPSF